MEKEIESKMNERMLYEIDVRFLIDTTLGFTVPDVQSLATHFALKDVLLEYFKSIKNPNFEVSQIIHLQEKSAEIKMLVKKIR